MVSIRIILQCLKIQMWKLRNANQFDKGADHSNGPRDFERPQSLVVCICPSFRCWCWNVGQLSIHSKILHLSYYCARIFFEHKTEIPNFLQQKPACPASKWSGHFWISFTLMSCLNTVLHLDPPVSSERSLWASCSWCSCLASDFGTSHNLWS